MVKKILLSLCSYLKVETNRGLAEYFEIPISQIYSWRKHDRITDTGKILAKNPEINPEWLKTGEGPMLRYQPPPGGRIELAFGGDKRLSFYGRLKTAMDERGIDLESLSNSVGIATDSILQWRDTGTTPDDHTIEKLSAYLSCRFQWLASGEGGMFPPERIEAVKESFEEKESGKPSVMNQTAKADAPLAKAASGETKIDLKAGGEDFSIADMLVMTSKVLESKTVYRAALASNVRAFYQAVTQEEEMNKVREEIAALRKENREVVERMARMEEMLASLGATLPSQKREQGNG